MSAILTTLGLRATGSLNHPRVLTGNYLIFHFFFAYCIVGTRLPKLIYGIDHQTSPRQDLDKYGAGAVKAGKLTQAQLDQLCRIESANLNSTEHYPVFAAALLLSHVAGLPTTEINAAGLAYTVARVVYAANYTFATNEKSSTLRGLAWWASNIVCLKLLWTAGRALNS